MPEKTTRRRKTRTIETPKEERRHLDVPGTVYVEQGITRNMGNYNSVKVTVGASLPLDPSEKDLEMARASIRKVVNLIDEELNKVADDIGL